MILAETKKAFVQHSGDLEGTLAFGLYLMGREIASDAKPATADVQAFRALALTQLDAVRSRAIAGIGETEMRRLALQQHTQELREDLKSVHAAHGKDLEQIKLEIKSASNIWKDMTINVVGGIVFGLLVLVIQLLPPVFSITGQNTSQHQDETAVQAEEDRSIHD